MYCRNCGAKFEDKEPKCPYCGTINLAGAEAQYMDKLENILEHTENLEEIPSETYTNQLKKHSKFTVKIVLIVTGICAGLFLLFQLSTKIYHTITERQIQTSRQEIRKFEEKYFPALEQLYEEGNDEATYNYLVPLYEEKGSDALFNWEHETYYLFYGYYQYVQQLLKDEQKQNISEDDWAYGLYCALQLSPDAISETDLERMSPKDKEKLALLQKEASEFLENHMNISVQKQKQIYKECCEDGFLSLKQCQKYYSKLSNK